MKTHTHPNKNAGLGKCLHVRTTTPNQERTKLKQTIIGKGSHSLFLSRSKHLRESRSQVQCVFFNEGSNDQGLWNYQ